MSASVTNYLAKHYLTADPAPSKKRKRKRTNPDPDTTFTIADDTLTGWERAHTADDTADDDPTIVDATATRQSKAAKWKIVGAQAPSNAETEAETADAIIAAAERDRVAAQREVDDAPAVVEAEGEPEDETLVGLRTGAEVTAYLERRRKRERKGDGQEEEGAGAETIYRDATGRVVNVAMKRAEARRKAEEEERKKVEEREAARGDVQRRQTEERRVALGAARLLTVARGKDDEEMNRELKEVERWNDPAARFLKTKTKTRSETGKPLYRGAFEPNRYGIRPGHRWDGVDRSNGFEKKWFAARSQKHNREQLEYAWEMDE